MPIQNWRELQYLLKQQQQGNPTIANNPVESLPEFTPEQKEQAEARFSRFISPSKADQFNVVSEAQDAYLQEKDDWVRMMNETRPDTGYGDYRKDETVPFDVWMQDPVNYRANAQSQSAKFFNGALKAIPYAVTTYLDNTLGLVSGLLGVGVDAVNGGEFNGTDSFINNRFSEWMQAGRDWSEKVLPNYRTQEEIDDEDEWWKHLNANFWGDVFLKNIGFTIGAGASGATFAKGFRALQGKTMNKAYKAALAAAGGDAEAEAAFQRVLQGGRMQDAKKIYDTFESTRKAFNRLGWEGQLVGGVGGAMGESRVEAMGAAKEFREEMLASARQDYESKKQQLAQDILRNPDYQDTEDVYDGFGNKIDERPTVSEAGMQAWEDGLAQIDEQYSKKLQTIDEQARGVANTTFWLNMPLLAGSNIIMFGRMFSGGFKSQARNKVGGKFGNYKGRGSVAGAVAGEAGRWLSEGVEELSQKVISEGAKDIGEKNIAAFNNGKYDKESIKNVSEWLMSMLDSAGNVITSPSSWEEFAVGVLTGGGSSMVQGAKNHSLGGISADLEQREANAKAAEELNTRIASDDFKALWGGMVRHNKYEDAKERALDKNDSFAWHTENDAQILSDVMMFANTGRLRDLEGYVDSFADLKLEDIPSVRSMLSDDTDSTFENKSDEQVLDWIHKRADEVKKTINQYRNFHDAIDFLSFGTSDQKAVDELIFTQAQLQNFEDRYNKILDEVITEIKPRIEDVAQQRKADGTPTDRAKQAQNLLASEDSLRRLFGGVALDIHGRTQDNADESSLVPYMLDDAKQESVLQTLEDWGAFSGNPALKEKVSDLQKLVRSRQNFYARLFDPKFRQKFEEQAQTDDTAAQELEADAWKKKAQDSFNKLKEAKSLREYLDIMNSLDEIENEEASNMLDGMIAADPTLKAYDDTVNKAMGYVSELVDLISSHTDNATDPGQIAALEDISSSLQGLDIQEILSNMPVDADPILEISRALLAAAGGDIRAIKATRGLLQEALGDIAQSNGLGIIPGTGEGDGGGEGSGGGTGSGGGVTQFKYVNDLLDATTDVNSSLLRKLIVGDFSDYTELSDEEKMQLFQKATEKYNRLREKLGLVATKDDKGLTEESLGMEDEIPDPNDPRRIRSHTEFVSMDTGSINGSHFSVYDPKSLRKGKAKPFTSRNAGTNATLSWLRKHHVQDFIDSGALAKLEREYRKKGKQLPIYFLANPHYVENNLETNPFVTLAPGSKFKVAPNVLLAVEMNEENQKILKAFGDAGVFSEETMITVNENGEQVKYQVIGEVWNPTPQEIAKKEADHPGEGILYQNVKQEANRIWEHAVGNSILPQYNSDVATAGTAAFSNEGKWYVAKIHPETDTQETETHRPDWTTGERLHTTLNYIMSGRNETRGVNSDTYERRSIKDTLKEYRSYGGEVHFALPVADDTIYSPGSPELPSSINAPAGSLWMATREANGAWAWTCLTIARTDEIDLKDQSLPLVKRLHTALNTLFATQAPGATSAELALSYQAKMQACKQISDIIYLGLGNTVTFSFTDTGVAVNIGGATCLNVNEAIEALTSGKYRIQVDMDAVSNPKMMTELIDSDVLKSEMRSFVRKGASIGVNFLQDTDADGNSVAPYPRGSRMPVSRTAGETLANTFVSSSDGVSNVRIGNAGYRLNKDGSVTRMTSRLGTGEPVDNKAIVAQVKAIAELMTMDSNDRLSDYPGRRWNVVQEDVYKTKNKTTGEIETHRMPHQYTALYEREVDGTVVHMVQRGKNGAIMLVYSDEEWNALMSVAKPTGNNYQAPAAPENNAADEAALNAARDEMLAAEAGGSVPAPKKVIGKRFSHVRGKGQASAGAKTVQEEDKQVAEDEENFNCG